MIDWLFLALIVVCLSCFVVGGTFGWKWDREEKRLEAQKSRVEQAEYEANAALWRACEKDDPQFLKDLGMEMPEGFKRVLEHEFRMLDPEQVKRRNRQLRAEALAKGFTPRGVQQIPQQYNSGLAQILNQQMGQQQAPPGTMIPVSQQQLQGLGSFAYLGKHAQQAQQQQRLLSQMFDQ